jgi:hypothetical protein
MRTNPRASLGARGSRGNTGCRPKYSGEEAPRVMSSGYAMHGTEPLPGAALVSAVLPTSSSLSTFSELLEQVRVVQLTEEGPCCRERSVNRGSVARTCPIFKV